jgi:hypothetical protein
VFKVKRKFDAGTAAAGAIATAGAIAATKATTPASQAQGQVPSVDFDGIVVGGELGSTLIPLVPTFRLD